jgi:mono/diheme cytochrome c family protein
MKWPRVVLSSLISALATSEHCELIARRFAIIAGLTVLLFLVACRQDMQDQPKLIPQRGSALFTNHSGARQQVANTVARGQLRQDSYFYTGLVQNANGSLEERDLMPFPATMEVLRRGQERFNIYCSPCHSRVGNGLGAIVERGYKQAANYHDKARLAQPVSHYFYIMTHGFGAMPDYSSQLAPEDRWAIAAYIRVLQRSQAATTRDVPAGVTIRNLKDLAQEKQLPAGYAEPWALPTTTIQAAPNDASQGYPALAPASQASPSIKIPASKPASAATK